MHPTYTGIRYIIKASHGLSTSPIGMLWGHTAAHAVPPGWIFAEGQRFEDIQSVYPELVDILRSSGYDCVPDYRLHSKGIFIEREWDE